jgi:hypothetical protein
MKTKKQKKTRPSGMAGKNRIADSLYHNTKSSYPKTNQIHVFDLDTKTIKH